MPICFPWFSAPSTWLSRSWCTALSFSIPSLLSSSLPFFPFCLIPFLSVSFTFFSQLPLFFCFVFYSPDILPQEVGPPRPPLPKSYQPLESSQSFPPSVPPLPLDSNAWLRSMGPHSGIHQEGYKDNEEFRSRKVPREGGSIMRTRNHTSTVFIFYHRYCNVNNISLLLSFINLNTSLSFHFTISLYIISVCFTYNFVVYYFISNQTPSQYNICCKI